MRKLMLPLACVSVLAAPVEAAAMQYDNAEVRPGTFVGARFQMSLGGRSASKPRATLAIAPTLTRMTGSAAGRTTIGEGVALNLRSRPTLTIAGMRADQVTGLNPSKDVDAKRKQGVSTGGWFAIGLGAIAVAGGLYFVYLVNVDRNNDDDDQS